MLEHPNITGQKAPLDYVAPTLHPSPLPAINLAELQYTSQPVWASFHEMESEAMRKAINQILFADEDLTDDDVGISPEMMEALIAGLEGRGPWPVLDLDNLCGVFDEVLDIRFESCCRVVNGRPVMSRQIVLVRESDTVEAPEVSLTLPLMLTADNKMEPTLTLNVLWNGQVFSPSTENISSRWSLIADVAGLTSERLLTESFQRKDPKASIYSSPSISFRAAPRNFECERLELQPSLSLHPALLPHCAVRVLGDATEGGVEVTPRAISIQSALSQLLMQEVKLPGILDEIDIAVLEAKGDELFSGTDEYRILSYEGFLVVAGPASTGRTLLNDLNALQAIELKLLNLDSDSSCIRAHSIACSQVTERHIESLLENMGFRDQAKIAAAISDAVKGQDIIKDSALEALMYRSVTTGLPLMIKLSQSFSLAFEPDEKDPKTHYCQATSSVDMFAGRSFDGVVCDELLCEFFPCSVSVNQEGEDAECVGLTIRASGKPAPESWISVENQTTLLKALGVEQLKIGDISVSQQSGCFHAKLPNGPVLVFSVPEEAARQLS